MKYQFIAEHRKEYPISTMCRVLEVAASGFYHDPEQSFSTNVRIDAKG